MSKIELYTEIKAPIGRCFDLSRSIDLHVVSVEHTNEKAVSGITSGLISKNESVTWEARHFGVVQQMTSNIPEFERPHFFLSVMEKGAFKSFRHTHEFKELGDKTVMIDYIEFKSPFGLLGKIIDRLVLNNYLKNLIMKRNKTIKQYAESDGWKVFIEGL